MILIISLNTEHFSFIPARLDAESARSPLAGCKNSSLTRQNYPMNCARVARRRVLCIAALLFVLINLGATGAFASTAQLSAITCTQSSYTGPGTDSCTVKLNQEAPAGGQSVSLSSNNAAVKVPASVTVAANAKNAAFTATVSAVGTAQVATLQATSGGVTDSVSLDLNAYVPTLEVSASSLAFGSVAVGSSLTRSETFTSTGTAPVTISATTPAGEGFSVERFTGSGVTLPLTLNPGKSATLIMEFEPTVAGAVTGQLSIVSNSSTGETVEVGLTGTGTAVLTALTCGESSVAGAATESCEAELNGAAPAGGMAIALSSNNGAVTVPASVTVPANASSAAFTATVASTPTNQTVTLQAKAGSVIESFVLQLNAAGPALSISPASLAFGAVALNTPATQAVTLTSTGNVPVEINSATLTGTGFSMTGTGIPVKLSPGQVATLNVQFDPTASGAASGKITVNSNASTNPTAAIALTGTGTASAVSLAGLSCSSASLTGPGTVACTVTLTSTSTSGSMTVNLASNNSAVTLPATVIVPQGASSAGFSATVSAVATSQTATLTATANGTSQIFSLTLTAGKTTPSITWAAPSAITYGTALSATQLNASSSVAGTFAYTPAAGTVLKAGAQTLSVTFTPTDTTDYSSVTQTVTLTVGKATPSITWAAPSAITSGTPLSATQLDATSTIPGTFVYSPAAGIILAVGSETLSVTFTPTDTTDYNTATQTVTLTVTAGTTPTLSIGAASVGFGSVALDTLATQTVTLTSTGNASVTVSSASVTGAGFSLAGSTFSATLTPGQTANLGVQFDPTVAGAATGQLTIVSNSSTNSTAVVPLTGTGTATAYAVDLSWNAPTTSADPVAGYNVYRALSGSSTYQLLNSSVDTQTTYTDSTVQNGQVYDYIVESVDDNGNESVPTTPVAVTIP